MPTYMIIEIGVLDQETYGEYMEQMVRWNASSEYQALGPLRVQSTRTRAIAVEGYAG